MCKVLPILHVLLSHLNLTTFLREWNNFHFPLSEEIYLVKDQVGIQRQVVRQVGNIPSTPLSYSSLTESYLPSDKISIIHFLIEFILPASIFKTASRNLQCTHSNLGYSGQNSFPSEFSRQIELKEQSTMPSQHTQNKTN